MATTLGTTSHKIRRAGVAALLSESNVGIRGNAIDGAAIDGAAVGGASIGVIVASLASTGGLTLGFFVAGAHLGSAAPVGMAAATRCQVENAGLDVSPSRRALRVRDWIKTKIQDVGGLMMRLGMMACLPCQSFQDPDPYWYVSHVSPLKILDHIDMLAMLTYQYGPGS